MSIDSLKQALRNLHASLEQAGEVDPELRALLQTLERDIQALLACPPGAGAPETNRLLEQAQSLGARFAVRHPHLEPALRELGDILARMGI